jgi:Trypsin-like peptidase domain
MKNKLDTVKNAIIKVDDGRGFIIEANKERVIITCGHCLPFFPPCHGLSYLEERTYPALLGSIGDAPPTIWAECLFVDPIADVAVLCGPDSQALYEEAEKYEELTDELPVIKIRAATKGQPVWVLGLNGEWRQGIVGFVSNRRLGIDIDAKFIEAGMSGSPILSMDAHAVGIVALGSNEIPGSYQLAPALPGSLPVWLGGK